MSTYNYSISTEFGGATGLNMSQLHDAIVAEAGITPTLDGLNSTGDSLDIVFTSALSGGEQTTLDSLVASHVPDNSPPRLNFYSFDPKKESINSTSYSKFGTFKYDGSDVIGAINYIDVVAYKGDSATSYSVRIYDRTNDRVVAEATDLTNTIEEIQSLGTVSNIPTQKAVFEVQAKRVGGNGNGRKVYIEQVIIYHNN